MSSRQQFWKRTSTLSMFCFFAYGALLTGVAGANNVLAQEDFIPAETGWPIKPKPRNFPPDLIGPSISIPNFDLERWYKERRKSRLKPAPRQLPSPVTSAPTFDSWRDFDVRYTQLGPDIGRIAGELTYADYLRVFYEKPLTGELAGLRKLRIVWIRKLSNSFCLQIDSDDTLTSLLGKRFQVSYPGQFPQGVYSRRITNLTATQVKSLLEQIKTLGFWNGKMDSFIEPESIKIPSHCHSYNDKSPIPLEDRIIVEEWNGGRYQLHVIPQNDKSIEKFLITQLRLTKLVPASDYEIY